MTFFKINFYKKIFKEHYQSAELFGSRSGPTEYPHSVGPDLGINSLQRLSADNKSCCLVGLIRRKKVFS